MQSHGLLTELLSSHMRSLALEEASGSPGSPKSHGTGESITFLFARFKSGLLDQQRTFCHFGCLLICGGEKNSNLILRNLGLDKYFNEIFSH